jgi:hypothetical protein
VILELISGTTGGFAAVVFLVLGTRAVHRAPAAPQTDADADHDLAEWARNTTLSVITVTGAQWLSTLSALQESEHGGLRSWNVPVSVSIWDHRDVEARMFRQLGEDKPRD